MQGFKEFLLRGNLVELAVAFVIGAAFSSVVESFTAMFMDVLGKIGGTPDFSSWNPGGVGVGSFLTALISFIIMATVIYFGVVMPYNKAKEFFDRKKQPAYAGPTTESLLAEIRDLLKEEQPR
ncbi:large conductance mechanosensitive channel protein MscL [Tessaracoccus palaemonis]|uniref:Large conductance mechanosensitive channel protein MscL n=1 Tax=Tessaracoccus palaemonis TaxID=2829499 RepID=A0ABX8SPX3_9ACTN|nr:large conductance mechanosensitive channel protein MscL [Tessaracoccus palaemonis]QXT64248.1 large conductance mechanosensitive channel protein MscL [Tessaracoccus palaemonis]